MIENSTCLSLHLSFYFASVYVVVDELMKLKSRIFTPSSKNTQRL